MTTVVTREPRPDWRESLTVAGDLAILGLVVVLGCLFIVPAGATVAAASTAVDQVCRQRTMPSPLSFLAQVGRGLWAGLGATLAVLAAAAVLAADLLLLRSSAVGGGTPAVLAIAVVAAVLVAVLAVATVRIGQTDGTGWRAALRWSLVRLRTRPLLGLLVLAVIGLPAFLGLMVPATAVLLPGFVLFGLHVVVRR